MPFVPENPVIFTAAYSGAIAGMAASGRYVQNSSESAFGGLSTLAGAFAQAFDAAWASAAAPSQLEVQAVEAACEGALQDRQPVFNQQSLLPAMWAPLAGAVAATLAQFAPPNEDCVMTVDVILTGRQIDTTDFAAWRMQGSWRVSPGTPPTLTPGTSEPTAVLISNTAAAAGVNPTWVLLGDGFASIQGQAWTFTSDIAWKSLAIPEDINDVGDVTFALSPAPVWGSL